VRKFSLLLPICGVFSSVKVYADDGYPDGFYGMGKDLGIYYLGTGFSCHVIDPPQMARTGGVGGQTELDWSSGLARSSVLGACRYRVSV